jgi:hypothetical protein
MTDSAAVILLIAASLVGLVLIPLGLPGLWVIVLAILGYGWLTRFPDAERRLHPADCGPGANG